jgi:threonine dehydrogenase-like Zn-dependent dehydrogenase
LDQVDNVVLTYPPGTAGTQAEYIRIPLGDVNLLPLPDSIPDEAGLYLSDVLPTAWNCVVDTGVKEGDVVAIWGAGPIGQMAAEFSFYNGASRVILIDGGQGAWRLKFCQSKLPKLELLDFTDLPKGESITSQLKKVVQNGPDVALECVAGEYAKGWLHYLELLTGAETDTSELLNEMITSVKNYGRVGVTGVYVGFVSPPYLLLMIELTFLDQPFQYRLTDGARHSFDREWTSTGPLILGASSQAARGRQDPPLSYANPSGNDR